MEIDFVTDDLIPNTVDKWPTIADNDIPRSRPEDMYRPPLTLTEFKSYIEKSTLYAPIKSGILAEIEKFRVMKQAERTR